MVVQPPSPRPDPALDPPIPAADEPFVDVSNMLDADGDWLLIVLWVDDPTGDAKGGVECIDRLSVVICGLCCDGSWGNWLNGIWEV